MSPEDKASRVLKGRMVAHLSVEVDQAKLEKVFIETVAGRPYTDATRDAVIQAIISSDAVKTTVKTEFISDEETKS